MLNLSVRQIGRLSIAELRAILEACEISERDFAMRLWNQIHERQYLIRNMEAVIAAAKRNGETESEIEAEVCRFQFASELETLNNTNQHFEHHLKRPNYRASKSAAKRLIEQSGRDRRP